MWRLQGVGPAPDRALAWDHFEVVMKATRDFLAARDVPLLVVALPARRDLEAAAAGTPPPQEHVRTRMLATASRLGIPALDATRLLAPVVARNGAGTCFRDQPPGDPHLNRHGHALLAAWLEKQLGVLFDGG